MRKNTRSWIKTLLLSLGVVVLIRTFAYTSCTIPFTGMENTLYQGDRVVVNLWAYGFRTPFIKLFGYHRWGNGQVSPNQIVVFNAPDAHDDEQAIDNRDVFISRCIGLPGDTLMLDERRNMVERPSLNPDYKMLYAYPGKADEQVSKALMHLGIRSNDLIGYQDELYIRSLSHYEVYLLRQEIGREVTFTPLQDINNKQSYPLIVPSKGQSVRVYPWNAKLLAETISKHEGKQAEVKHDTLYVNGHSTLSYSFKQDYYWMVSNNSANVNDSRRFGFVPQSHLIGKAQRVWFSKDPKKNWIHGYRWNRFFRLIK